MTYREHMAAAEKRYLTELLRRHGGRVIESAKEAGLSRPTFWRLRHKYGLPVSWQRRAHPGNAAWQALQ
jgi:transcriptional regulator of acetoin/glycerol metabolism